MLTDQELQSLRNMGNEAEEAADEIMRLREELALMTRDRDSWIEQASARTQDALDLIAAERERCAKAAEEYLTRGRSPLGRAVADAIRKA